MSYDQLLQDLLEELGKCESLREIRDSLDLTTTINNILKRLNTSDWKISIDKAYKFRVATVGKYKIGSHGWLKLSTFEEFKEVLMDAVNYYLTFMESRRYTSIKDYREKAVPVAIEIRDKITEDLYEDIMAELRRGKNDKSRYTTKNLTAKINSCYYKLQKTIESVAREWAKENLAPGMKVMLLGDEFTTAKVVRSGSSIIVTLKDSDKVSYDLEGINTLALWIHYVKEAKSIYDRVTSFWQ